MIVLAWMYPRVSFNYSFRTSFTTLGGSNDNNINNYFIAQQYKPIIGEITNIILNTERNITNTKSK